MKNLVKFIEETGGFKGRVVTAEEFEDGVGAGTGQNYVKDQVWYTEAQALEEIDCELKFSSGDIQAKNLADARDQALKMAEAAGVKAIEVKVSRWGNSDRYSVRSRYIK